MSKMRSIAMMAALAAVVMEPIVNTPAIKQTFTAKRKQAKRLKKGARK